MSKPLLSKRSSLISRRNVIVYIIATILILGIVAGFTNVFHTDNRRIAAGWGETIVIESQPPATGSPADYDLLSNLKYTAYKIHHAKYFKGYTEGRVSADVGGVGNYTQYLTNNRVVYNQNIVFTETISWSSLKSLAEQKYIDNGVIIYRGADKTSGGKATYSSKASQMSYEQYSKNYGAVPNQLSKYIINEKTILAVKDENATAAPRLNANGATNDGDGEVGFEVPASLVPNADGNFVFTLTLDPTESSLYYRNEVRTLGGADQNPKFYAVKITVTVNSEWIPISTRTLEEYDIEIPVLGAMRCYGDNYEVFTMIDDENGNLPEKDFFQPYVDQAKANPDYKPPEIKPSGPLSASDYLAAAFADYLSGAKNLDLAVDITASDVPALGTLSAYDLNLSVNLDTMDVQAKLGDGLFIKYAGDKVYLKNGKINGFVSADAAAKLTDDPLLQGLLSFGALDMQKIFGGDMLDVIFNDSKPTEEDGVITIPMSFSLDLSDVIPALDGVQVDASIKINSADKSLNSIVGCITVGGTVIEVEAAPLKSAPAFPSTDGATDLSAMLDFVPAALATANQTTYGVDGTLTLNGTTVGLNAYVDRTDGITAEAALTVMGVEVLVKYVDGTIYAQTDGAKVRGTIDELPQLLDLLLDSIDTTDFAKYEKLLKAMLPSSVNQIVDMLKTVEVTDDTLNIGLSFIGMPIDVTLTRADGKLSSLALGVNVDLFGIKADAAVDLKLSQPAKRTVTAPADADEYIGVNALTSLANVATRIVEAGGVHTVAAVTMGDVTLNAAVDCTVEDGILKAVVTESSLGLTMILIDDTAYITVGGVKVSGQLKDITAIMDAVLPNLPDVIRPYVEKMTAIMLGIIPTQDELTTDGQVDIQKVLDVALAALTSLSMHGDDISVSISRGPLSANLVVTPDLSCVNGNVTLTFDGIGGPFGDHYEMAFGLGLQGLTACTVTVPTVNSADYVKASELITALDCMLPLLKQNAFDLGISATVFDQTVTGNVYIDIGDYDLNTIAVKAAFDIAGTPIVITVADKTLYLDINSGAVRLAQPLTNAAITELIAQIDEAMPELKLGDKIAALIDSLGKDISVSDILGGVTLSPAQNGIALTAAFGDTTVNATITVTDGVLSAISVQGNIGDKQIALALGVQTADGVLCGLTVTQANIAGVELDLALTLSSAENKRDVTPDGEYVQVSEFVQYIAPINALVDKATTANTVTIDLSDMTIEVMGKLMTVSGKLDLSLNPVNVRGRLTLFADSDEEKVDLTVTYADGVLYLNIGKVSLKFDIQNDMGKLNQALEPYMPKSLKKLGDLGALSPIFAVIDNIGKITEAQDVAQIMSVLFDDDNAYGKSMVRLVTDMIRLFEQSDGGIAVGVNVMDAPFAVTLNVQPIISGGFLDFKLGLAVSNILAVNLTAKIDFTNEQFTVSAPSDADSYTPIVDFVTTVINGVNTITAKVPDEVTTDDEGNTTTISQTAFEVDSFAFDYDIFKTLTTVDENGDVVEVKDEAGRAQIAKDEAGNKIKEKTILLSNIDGQKALRFGLTTTTVKRADGTRTKSTKLAIEAHIRLGITDGDGNAQIGFPIELDLYVQPLDTPEGGLAYLYYREANGYGEKLSIDYESVLQMVTAVLEILNADGDVINDLFGNYKLDMDTSVFEFMAIAGLDDAKQMVNNLLLALDEAKLALADAKAAWNRIQTAEDLDALIYDVLHDESKLDQTPTAKAYLDSAISHIKAAVALFKTEEDDAEQAPEDGNRLNGAIVGKVVNSVYFNSKDSVMSAFVDNAVATGTEGWAIISVTSADDKINDIGVKNLDVNTAKLNEFTMSFAPTHNVTVTIPDDYTAETTDGDKVRYADLSNLKHLIFDVMNTANMLEFDIGGLQTDDVINIKLHLAGLDMVDLNIHYDVKVKIIQDGTDEDGRPMLKTAAVVELEFKNCKALGATVVPDCTTRLYFYDDVLYVQGVDYTSSDSQERIVGTITDIYCDAKGLFGKKETRYPEIVSTEYAYDTTDNLQYIDAMYTIDELFWMVSNDMGRFMSEFLFYLVPLSRHFTFAGIDLQARITEAMSGTGSNAVNTQNTIAQIIKQYTYDNGNHTLRIGLKELAGSSALSDLTVRITGANDGDDDTAKNVLNNYISKLHVDTNIQNNLIQVTLDATLNNVREKGGRIESKGLGTTNVTREIGKYSVNGANYVYDCTNYDRNVIYTLDGKTYLTENGTALYLENGSIAPTLRRTDSSDVISWTSTFAETRYCKNVYQAGDVGATYHYTASLAGYGYRYDGTDSYYIGTDGNGNKYVYRVENGNQIRVEVRGVTTSLLAQVTRNAKGKITSVENRSGGVQWSRPWQAAYESAQQAA
ncbi:MAG: hypothetical protein K2F90_02540 [Clostridiales bacterium]|nr:hypothetical protein [Clostridiales bacterium]